MKLNIVLYFDFGKLELIHVRMWYLRMSKVSTSFWRKSLMFICSNFMYLHKNDLISSSSNFLLLIDRSSHPEVLSRKGVLKICSKFTGEQPWWSGISIKLQSSFIEIALRHGCSPVNLLQFFRTPFLRNTSRWLLLDRDSIF